MQTETVLLLGGDPNVRDLIRINLVKRGHRVIGRQDAASGLEGGSSNEVGDLAQWSVDLIVFDVGPRPEDASAASRLLAGAGNPTGVPIVLLVEEPTDFGLRARHPQVKLIAKPFRIRDLLDVIRASRSPVASNR